MQKGRYELSGAESVSEKGGKFEHTCNQQYFSLSNKRSLGQKQLFDNEWVMFESYASARVNLLMI